MVCRGVPAGGGELPVRYEAWENPATRAPAVHAALVHQEMSLRPLMRMLYTRCLRGGLHVQDTDLANMGLPERFHGKGKRAPRTDEPPGVKIEPLAGDRVRVRVFDSTAADRKGKPEGQRAVEFLYAIATGNQTVTPRI